MRSYPQESATTDSIYYFNETPYLIIPNNRQNYDLVSETILKGHPDILNTNTPHEKFFNNHWHGSISMTDELNDKKSPYYNENLDKISEHFLDSEPYNYELVSPEMASFLDKKGYCILNTNHGKVWAADTLGIHYGSRDDFQKLIKEWDKSHK